MIRCTCCKKLIGVTTMSYKISSGFIDDDGNFMEDIRVIIHPECSTLIEPFQKLEEILKNS